MHFLYIIGNNFECDYVFTLFVEVFSTSPWLIMHEPFIVKFLFFGCLHILEY
jgi:hypothetical protein